MSDDLISREDVCLQLLKQESIDRQPRAIRRARRIVENCPAAEVKPVVYAHWYINDGCAYCSNCRNNFKKAILNEVMYCPRCGALLKGYGGDPT